MAGGSVLQQPGSEASGTHLRIGAFTVDPDAGTIEPAAGGRARHLPPHAMATLLGLARQRGTVVSRESLLQQWPAGYERTDEALTHVVHLLREALADDARHPTYIRTAKHRGYALLATVQDGRSAVAPPRPGTSPTRMLARIAVVYLTAAWIVIQFSLPVFDLGPTGIRALVGALILGFPLALGLAWWFQRNFDLPAVLERLLGLLPQSDAALIGYAIVVCSLLFVVSQSLPIGGEEGRAPPEPPGERLPELGEAARLSVAVLPFVFEGDASHAFLGDGIADELIAVLSRLSELQVVSRTVSFDYRGGGLDLHQIAQRLQVAHIVEGSVVMEGGRLRVTVKLVDTPSGRAIWSQRYRRKLGSVFDIYDVVVTRLARELALTLSPELHASLAPMRTRNADAYLWYLQGRERLRRPPEGAVLLEAEEYFQRALDEDAAYARAYAGLCDVNLARYRGTRDNAFIAPAVEACDRALELDPRAVEVQVARARLYMETGDLELADEALEAALATNPDHYETRFRLGDLRARQQRLGDAEAAYLRAIELQPGNWMAHSAYGLMLLERKRDYASAQQHLEKVVALLPGSSSARNNLAACYLWQGRFEDVLHVYASVPALTLTKTSESNIGLTYYYLHDYDAAVEHLQQAVSLDPTDHRVWGNLALAQSYSTRDPGVAARSYARAVQLAIERLATDPSDADALGDLATYHAALGARPEALASIDQALALSRDDAAIQHLAASAYALLGMDEEASAASRRALVLGYSRRILESDARLHSLALASGES